MQNNEQVVKRIAHIREDREHGSRWLAREAVLVIRDLASAQGPEDERLQRVYTAARELALARPAMSALTSAVAQVVNVQGGTAAIARASEQLLQTFETATGRIAAYAAPLIHGTIMTCSVSGTIVEVLTALKPGITRVIALEGRPRYEGREMARLLSAQGIAVTLITDAQADIFLPQCQSVVVGADSILAGGDVLNKAGTALLAWAARGHQLPLYVLCETLKISSRRWSEDRLDLLEEKEPAEVLAQPIAGVSVRNFYFDRTPASLASSVITERGILDTHELEVYADKVKTNVRFLHKIH